MAKQRTENVPPAALWKDTFSDLMNLLLCFFVLMFAMSNIDSQKFEEIAASLSSSFSVLPQGGSALSKEGILVSSGASQLNELSNYYNNMGLNNDGNMSQDVQNAYEEIEKKVLSSLKIWLRRLLINLQPVELQIMLMLLLIVNM